MTTRPGVTMLISVLILSAILFTLGIAGLKAFIQETRTLTITDTKLASTGSAMGCMEEALNRLGRNSGYAGNETLTIGTTTCTIRPITIVSGQWILQTEATVQSQTTREQVQLSAISPMTVASWKEVAGF